MKKLLARLALGIFSVLRTLAVLALLFIAWFVAYDRNFVLLAVGIALVALVVVFIVYGPFIQAWIDRQLK